MKYLILALLIASSAYASEPIGSYSSGSLIDGECMDESGEGYMQLYRDVGHIFATHELITMVQGAARDMSRKYPNRDRLQVEEMSGKNGGDIDPHGSHENGLDVDIQYFKANNKEHDPATAKDYYADPMVESGSVSSNFDVERNWELAKALHRNGAVSRIFMDSVLKRSLCSYAKSKGEYSSNIQVLRSIRHVENHQDHMHVRLSCPANARQCRNQPAPPAGSGCP